MSPSQGERTRRPMGRAQVLLAAARRGMVALNAAALARRAGVSRTTAWRWWAGIQVRPEQDAALRRALGLPRRSAAPFLPAE